MTDQTLSINDALNMDWDGEELDANDEQEDKTVNEAPEEEDAEDEEIQDAGPTADEEDEAPEEVTESDDEEADEDDDAEDGPEEQVTVAVEIPKSWGDEEAKAKFVQLPPELQQYVASRESERDKATQRILSESGQERKKAVEATQLLGSHAQRAQATLDAIDQAINASGYDKWTPQDWYELSVKRPDDYSQHKAYAELLQQQKQQAEQVRNNARLAQQESFAEEQANLLKTHAPEVLEHHSDIVKYLGDQFGYTADQVRLGSAADRLLAYKAMQFDAMQASAKEKASAKPKAKPAPKGLKASSGQTSTSSQRKTANAKKAFQKNPSLKNAMDLLPDF